MSLGLLGKKLGMTHIYDDKGKAVAVTVVDVSQNEVTQVKNTETDGYSAVQIGFIDKRESRSNKPEIGHFKKAGAAPKSISTTPRERRGARSPPMRPQPRRAPISSSVRWDATKSARCSARPIFRCRCWR